MLEIEAQGDQVVARVRFRARGRAGIEVDIELGHRYTVKNGKLRAFQGYADFAQALAAAGIR